MGRAGEGGNGNKKITPNCISPQIEPTNGPKNSPTVQWSKGPRVQGSSPYFTLCHHNTSHCQTKLISTMNMSYSPLKYNKRQIWLFQNFIFAPVCHCHESIIVIIFNVSFVWASGHVLKRKTRVFFLSWGCPIIASTAWIISSEDDKRSGHWTSYCV